MTTEIRFTEPSDKHPFARVWQRTRRCAKLYNDLRTLVSAYQSSKPFHFKTDLDAINGRSAVTLVQIEPVPEEIGFLTSELVHHLRGSLDNLAFLLGSLNPGSSFNPEVVTWPIFQSRDDFLLRKNAKLLAMFCESDLKQIKALNPTSQNVHILWILHKLSNFDKHRLPIEPMLQQPRAAFGGLAMRGEHGEELARVVMAEGEWTPGMIVMQTSVGEVSYDPPVWVMLNLDFLEKRTPLLELMATIGKFVDMTVRTFILRHTYPSITAEVADT